MIVKFSSIIALFAAVNSLELKQVVVLSRHGIRTPLAPALKKHSGRKWPEWNLPEGYLTEKGGLVEREMGKYFADWLGSQRLLNDDCPDDNVFVYANTKQRTKETAKKFVEGAFGNCVEVYVKNMTEMDPVFNPIVRNASLEFKDSVLKEMQKKLDKVKLKAEFKELERILDFKNSTDCLVDKVCDLTKAKHEIYFEVNKQPRVFGPLLIGNGVVDAFLMENYEGMAANDVAWGEITEKGQWESLYKILETLHDVLFRTRMLNKDLALDLIAYMKDIFINGKKKFYLLVGHDANINNLLSALNFKDYNLYDQYEKTPIGGKIVFQKLYDAIRDQNLLHVDYVYQSTKQIRDGAALSLHNPPQWVPLEIEGCTVDGNGFCLWEDFLNIFNNS